MRLVFPGSTQYIIALFVRKAPIRISAKSIALFTRKDWINTSLQSRGCWTSEKIEPTIAHLMWVWFAKLFWEHGVSLLFTGKVMNADRIEILEGDITKQQMDAIVNAANTTLLGGGGVDGAIHRAAGRELLEECRTLGGCPTGQAKITKGYRLPAQWVIHTVGPVWQDGRHGEDELLASCYRNSLVLAVKHGIRTIAFPSISTDAYGFPMERAARIALREIANFLQANPTFEKVTLVCFGKEAWQLHCAVRGHLIKRI